MSTSRTAPRLTICGIAELGEHSAAGVTHVLSLLGPTSPDPPEFAAFAPHRRLILRFHDVIEPQPDQIAPTREDVERLLVFGREVGETPQAHLLVHCRAGVSRSTQPGAVRGCEMAAVTNRVHTMHTISTRIEMPTPM